VISRLMVTLVLIWVTCIAAVAEGESDQSIRVGLCYGSSAIESAVIVGVGAGEGERSRGGFDDGVVVRACGDELVLEHGDRQVRVGRWVEFWPTGDHPWLELNGATYRGRLRLEAEGYDRLKVINTLNLEDYVRGVIANEMFAHPTAYRVQAVISRTYALYVRDIEKKHRREGFDICTTGHCQVYRGVDSERPLADEAVEATVGEVLVYRGQPIFSAYHANAGGLTQSVDEAWPGSIRDNFPYLCSVESPYDNAAGELNGYRWCYRWQRTLTPSEIAERLRSQGRDIGEVRDITVKERTSTGRVGKLEIVGRDGRVTLNTPSDVRAVMGTPSARFAVSNVSGCFEIEGSGRGHGVGLSQHGALGMAKNEIEYDEILGHYYRGVALCGDYGRGESRSLTPPHIEIESSDSPPVMVPPGIS